MNTSPADRIELAIMDLRKILTELTIEMNLVCNLLGSAYRILTETDAFASSDGQLPS